MGDVISIPSARARALFMPPDDQRRLEALQACRTCGEAADWGDPEEDVAYCGEHDPWTDKDLARRVNGAANLDEFRGWLDALPPERRMVRVGASCGPLREYLNETTKRRLHVNPPAVRLEEDWSPVANLPPWTRRFDDMLMWVEGDEGAPPERCLQVLAKAAELEQLASQGPLEAIAAKARESELLPPEIGAAMIRTFEEAQKTKRKGLLGRLFGDG